MSVIKREELITDQAVNWPKEYKKDLEELIVISKKLSQPTNQPKVPGSDPKTRKNLDELAKVQNQLAKATERSSKEFLDQKASLDKLNKENREAVKTINAQTDAYDKLDRELTSTRKAYKNLAAAGKENTAEAKKLLTQTKKLDTQLKKIDNTVGQNQRSVGKYSNALKGVTARFLGWAAVAGVLFKALKSGITIVLNYSKANSVLRGILRKTKEETIALRKQQQELGKSTAFTATQVTKSQTELAKLGFTMGQIIDLTPAILDASVALGVDMAEAAELVAGQLNAFGKATEEGAQVADVLTRSTQISTLTFDRLKNSLDKVGKISEISNVSFEKTVATLGAVTDTNIKAEKAGTAFRNILLLSAKAGIPYEEMLQKINDSSTKAKTAVELFGKQNAAVAIVIAENTEKINENTKALDNAAGAAKEFADEALDNLSGDMTLTSSAWEGFILSLEEGDGVLATAIRAVIQLTTAFLGFLTSLSETNPGLTEFSKNLKNLTIEEKENELKKLSDQALIYSNSLERVNLSTEEFLKLSANERSDVRRAQRDSKEVQKDLDNVNERIKLLTTSLEKKVAIDKINTKETNLFTKEIEKEIIQLKKLDSLIAKLPEKLTAFQKGLLSITDALFGKNTIDEDAEKFISKVDKTIRKTAESNEKNRKDQLEQDQLLADAKAAIVDQSFELASEIGNSFTQLRIQQISDELNALEFARDRELEEAEKTGASKDAINKKFDEERKKLQRKQVIAERANALFSIALNTAIGITNALSKVVTAPLVPFIAAAGAVQAAAVLAAPIPQFDEGIERTPSGKFMVAEKRPELMKHQGKWGLVKEPTMFKNSPGDTIVSGKETDSILGSMADLTGKNMLTDPGLMLGLMNNDFEKKKATVDLAYVIKKTGEDTVRAINKKKFLDIQVNTARSFVTEINGQTRIEHINQYYRS